jgi:hypothetical protein
MVGGWYLNLTFCFMATAHEPLHLDKQSFVQWKIADIPTCFIWIIISLMDVLNMVVVEFSNYWGGWKTCNSQWRTIQFCLLTDEQLFIRPLLWESKNINVMSGWKLKFTFYFMERTYKPLHLDRSFVHWQIMDISTSFIWIIIFFDGAFEYGGIVKLWHYVGTNSKLLFTEFCNFVHCHINISFYLVIVLSKVFWILEIPTWWPKKYSRLYRPINLFIFRIYDMG